MVYGVSKGLCTHGLLFWTDCTCAAPRYSVLMARLFTRCEYEAGSDLISGWNSVPSLRFFQQEAFWSCVGMGRPSLFVCVCVCACVCVCVCVCETERDPLSPQGYIITRIIRPGQPEKEESKKAIEMNSRGPLSESYWFWKIHIARTFAHTHTHRISDRDESLSVLSNVTLLLHKSERGGVRNTLKEKMPPPFIVATLDVTQNAITVFNSAFRMLFSVLNRKHLNGQGSAPRLHWWNQNWWCVKARTASNSCFCYSLICPLYFH